MSNKARYNNIVTLTENLRWVDNEWQIISLADANRIIDAQTKDPYLRQANVLVKGQREKLLIYNCYIRDKLTAMITWQPPWAGEEYWTKVQHVPCKYLVDEHGDEITVDVVKKGRIERVLEDM